jgi:hypothetical protein
MKVNAIVKLVQIRSLALVTMEIQWYKFVREHVSAEPLYPSILSTYELVRESIIIGISMNTLKKVLPDKMFVDNAEYILNDDVAIEINKSEETLRFTNLEQCDHSMCNCDKCDYIVCNASINKSLINAQYYYHSDDLKNTVMLANVTIATTNAYYEWLSTIASSKFKKQIKIALGDDRIDIILFIMGISYSEHGDKDNKKYLFKQLIKQNHYALWWFKDKLLLDTNTDLTNHDLTYYAVKYDQCHIVVQLQLIRGNHCIDFGGILTDKPAIIKQLIKAGMKFTNTFVNELIASEKNDTLHKHNWDFGISNLWYAINTVATDIPARITLIRHIAKYIKKNAADSTNNTDDTEVASYILSNTHKFRDKFYTWLMNAPILNTQLYKHATLGNMRLALPLDEQYAAIVREFKKLFTYELYKNCDTNLNAPSDVIVIDEFFIHNKLALAHSPPVADIKLAIKLLVRAPVDNSAFIAFLTNYI